MSKTIEDEAKQYAEEHRIPNCPITLRKTVNQNHIANAFQDGANFALTHQWRSVEDELPPIGILFFCRDGARVAICAYDGENICEVHSGDKCQMPFWMPIPSLNHEQL